MGASYSPEQASADKYAADKTYTGQIDTNASNEQVATIQAQAVMDGNSKQLSGTEDTNKTEKTIQFEALRIREKEIDDNYKLGVLQAQNDAGRVAAQTISAEAQQTKADATYLKEQDRHDEKQQQLDSGSSSSYWYGQ